MNKQDYKKELVSLLSMNSKNVKTMCEDLLIPYETFRQPYGYNTMRLAWCQFKTTSKTKSLMFSKMLSNIEASKQVRYACKITNYLHSLKNK